jgi:hypothetical protein
MRDPKKILTEDGYRKYQMHLMNMAEAIGWISSHADDLYLDDHVLLAFDRADSAVGELLNKNDFEEDED